ncbi:MAG: sulfatase-like hydrolase/transferase, partial [Planctomycetes bacterium]|nr:sulfatase-like hydrolase/transferase [Planctomycetota bacterium]
AFGRLLKTVDNLASRDNTLVYFTSDNGPAITSWHPHGSAGPLRDKKGYLYEGGIRVPGIIRWPGHTKPAQVCDEPVSGVDLLPTLCAIAGIDVPNDRTIDGASFLPIFKQQAIERKQPLYWQFNPARGKPKVALRDGKWKILASLTGPEIKPYGDLRAGDSQALKSAELADFELYNLQDAIDESNDRSAAEAVRFKKMSSTLRKIYADVRSESPVWPTWIWPRFEGKRIRAGRETAK